MAWSGGCTCGGLVLLFWYNPVEIQSLKFGLVVCLSPPDAKFITSCGCGGRRPGLSLSRMLWTFTACCLVLFLDTLAALSLLAWRFMMTMTMLWWWWLYFMLWFLLLRVVPLSRSKGSGSGAVQTDVQKRRVRRQVNDCPSCRRTRIAAA